MLRLVNEPTAASLAYGLDKKRDGIVAVYDFGGGTFDVSILKLHEGIFEVIATNGDTHLGGDDIDNLLIAIALDDIKGDMGLDLRRNGEAVQRSVMPSSKRRSRSRPPTDQIDVESRRRKTLSTARSRARILSSLSQPVIARTLAPVQQALKDAKLKPADQ